MFLLFPFHSSHLPFWGNKDLTLSLLPTAHSTAIIFNPHKTIHTQSHIMGQDDKNGQKEGQGQAQAEPLPQEGDQALLISRPDAADQQNLVVKRAPEVQVNDQAEGAAKANNSTTEGEGQASKQADSTSGSTSNNTRKRKEQASTPTKKAAPKGKTGGDRNGENSAKKVRTGKEDDIFGSDIESDNDDEDDKGEEDKDIVLEDADPVVDPDETEDEQDHLKAAAGEGTKGEGQDNKKEEGAAATDANTAGETGTAEPRRIIRKPHGHSKSIGGASVLQPAAAASSSDGKDNTKSNTTTTSGAGTSGNNGNGKEKPRSASTSAASGKVGNGDAGISRKEEEKRKSHGGVASKGEEEEGKEHQLKSKGSINEILNEEDKKEKQDRVKVPAASLPPRHAKEVAEEKIAGASGTGDHAAGPGTGSAEEAGKKTAAAVGAAGGAEADKSGGGGPDEK